MADKSLTAARRKAADLFYGAHVAYNARESKILALRGALVALDDEDLAALELPLRKHRLTSMGVWDALMEATSEVEFKRNGWTKARKGCIAPLYEWWAEH